MTSCGVLYIAFGDKARRAVADSCATLREHTPQLSITVIGEMPISSLDFIPWKGTKRLYNKRGVFLNGDIKPHLCELTPYDLTLFMDADTTVFQDVRPGFDFLKENDICLANHYNDIRLKDVYPSRELADTIAMCGANTPHLNTGVIFFRKNEAVARLFRLWLKEFEAYRIPNIKREWDDQLALHRALVGCQDVRVKFIEEKWNQKFPNEHTVIWHQMGSFIAQARRWK